MKKLLCIAVAAAMLLSLAACSGGNSQSEKDTPPETEANIGEMNGADGGEIAEGTVVGDYKYTKNEDQTATVTGYIGSDTEVTLPTEIDGLKVSALGDGAFANNATIKKVTVPEGYKTLVSGCFYQCDSLEEVYLPESLEEIGRITFNSCKNLTVIDIKDSLKECGGFAFFMSKWIDQFTDEFVIIGDGILIDYNGDGGDVKIPDNVRVIAGGFYQRSDVKSVSFPESLVSVSYGTMDGTGISEIILPDSVTKLEIGAFANSASLKTVTIGKGMKTIEGSVFINCSAIEKVNYRSSESDWKKISIDADNDSLTNAKFTYNAK